MDWYGGFWYSLLVWGISIIILETSWKLEIILVYLLCNK
jgi:hypothetical protein